MGREGQESLKTHLMGGEQEIQKSRDGRVSLLWSRERISRPADRRTKHGDNDCRGLGMRQIRGGLENSANVGLGMSQTMNGLEMRQTLRAPIWVWEFRP